MINESSIGGGWTFGSLYGKSKTKLELYLTQN